MQDTGNVRPHTWQECFPVLADAKTGEVDLKDEKNRIVRRIFRQLGQLDRIKFHQANCQHRLSPAHLATIDKIRKRLAEAGIGDGSLDEPQIRIIAVIPAHMAKNWPYSDVPNPITVQHSPCTCGRCGQDAWIGPKQKSMATTGNIELVCRDCLYKDQELAGQTAFGYLNPEADALRRRFPS